MEALGGLSDKDFYQFVMTRYDFINNPRKFYGFCGKPIASYAYMDVFEKRIFGSLDCFDGYNFGKDTMKELEKIRDEIKGDLEKGIYNNYYMEDGSGSNLTQFLGDLKSCRVKGIDDLIKSTNMLCWYLGRNENVLELQVLLNELHLDSLGVDKLVEDGIYDSRTRYALYRVCEFIVNGEHTKFEGTVIDTLTYGTMSADIANDAIIKKYGALDPQSVSNELVYAEIIKTGSSAIAIIGVLVQVRKVAAMVYLDYSKNGKITRMSEAYAASRFGSYALSAAGSTGMAALGVLLKLPVIATALLAAGTGFVLGYLGGKLSDYIYEVTDDKFKVSAYYDLEHHTIEDF